jgi:transcriptional regulator with XRE-family HTH domain
MTLGRKIATLRKQRDWTQDQFAEKVGVHGRHISRWETDKIKPPIKKLGRIAEVLDISVEELIRGNGGEYADIQDEDLVNQLKQVEELDDEDKKMVVRLIDALVTKKKMENVLRPHK